MPNAALITSRDICNQAVVERILADDSVSSIKIAANLQSDTYDGGVIASDPGTAGWRIERNTGNIVFNDGFFRSDLISADWDGNLPATIASNPDETATGGVYVDGSEGSAQFSGQVYIGNGNTTTAQFFIANELQHINLRESDDVDYPDKVFILDVNGGLGRLLWLDETGAPAFQGCIEMHQDGTVDIVDGPLTVDAGSAAAPGITSDAATTTGMYWHGDGVGLAVGGTAYFTVDSTTTAHIETPAGNSTQPGIAFLGDTNSGIFQPDVDQIGVTLGGSEAFRYANGQFLLASDGSAGSPIVSFVNDTDTGIYRTGTDQLSLAAGSAEILRLVEGTANAARLAQSGNATAPSLSFTADTNTGIYQPATDQLSLGAGGVELLRVAEGTNDQVLLAQNGSSGVPSLGFLNSTGSGMYWSSGATQIKWSVDGTDRFIMGTTAFAPNADASFNLGSSSLTWNVVYRQSESTGSDVRIKTDVDYNGLPTDWLHQLQPVTYRLTDQPDKLRTGLIAQDVIAAVGSDWELVHDEDPDHLGLSYEQLIPVLWAIVQAQDERIAVLEAA